MPIINQESENGMSYWRYRDDTKVRDTETACKWLSKIMKDPALTFEVLSFHDLQNKEERNTGREYTEKKTAREMMKIIENLEIDAISITGEYKKKTVLLGVVLEPRIIGIVLDERDSGMIREIEKWLQLEEHAAPKG